MTQAGVLRGADWDQQRVEHVGGRPAGPHAPAPTPHRPCRNARAGVGPAVVGDLLELLPGALQGAAKEGALPGDAHAGADAGAAGPAAAVVEAAAWLRAHAGFLHRQPGAVLQLARSAPASSHLSRAAAAWLRGGGAARPPAGRLVAAPGGAAGAGGAAAAGAATADLQDGRPFGVLGVASAAAALSALGAGSGQLGGIVASAGCDKCVRLWDSATRSALGALPAVRQGVTTACFAAQGGPGRGVGGLLVCAAAPAARRVWVWGATSGCAVAQLRLPAQASQPKAPSPAGHRPAQAEGLGGPLELRIRVNGVSTGAGQRAITCLAAGGPGCGTIVAGASDGAVWGWQAPPDLPVGPPAAFGPAACLQPPSASGHAARALSFGAEDRGALAVADEGGRVAVFRLRPDGPRLAALATQPGSAGGPTLPWDLAHEALADGRLAYVDLGWGLVVAGGSRLPSSQQPAAGRQAEAPAQGSGSGAAWLWRLGSASGPSLGAAEVLAGVHPGCPEVLAVRVAQRGRAIAAAVQVGYLLC